MGVYATNDNDSSKGHISLKDATVNVTGHSALRASGALTIDGGDVTANGRNNGLHSNKGITIIDCIVNATGNNGYGIYTGSGSVTITGSDVTANGNDGYGIYAEYDVNISASQVTTIGYMGILSQKGSIIIDGGDMTATGRHGLVSNSASITINDCILKATGTIGAGINAKGSMTITNSDVTAISNGNNNYGIIAEENLTISGGKVTATGSYGIRRQASVTINGGQVTATGTQYGFFAISGITLGWTNDSDFIHANSYFNNAGSITIADGKAFIDEDNNIYSGTIEKVNGAYAIDDKTLRPYSPALRGDVNGDGEIGIADVTALIDYILSGDASDINLDAADCDQNGEIGISDVTALIDYLLNGSW